ncbi:hypothetical protein PIB30_083701, partial [Stylosanthes scabra]|nr:hypothetical protein [Stylosanthes scabra]
WRNREKHEPNYTRPRDPHSQILKQVHNIREAFKKANLVGRRLEKMEIRIKWSPPPQG